MLLTQGCVWWVTVGCTGESEGRERRGGLQHDTRLITCKQVIYFIYYMGSFLSFLKFTRMKEGIIFVHSHLLFVFTSPTEEDEEPYVTWMTDSLHILGNRRLNQIAIPGIFNLSYFIYIHPPHSPHSPHPHPHHLLFVQELTTLPPIHSQELQGIQWINLVY